MGEYDEGLVDNDLRLEDPLLDGVFYDTDNFSARKAENLYEANI